MKSDTLVNGNIHKSCDSKRRTNRSCAGQIAVLDDIRGLTRQSKMEQNEIMKFMNILVADIAIDKNIEL